MKRSDSRRRWGRLLIAGVIVAGAALVAVTVQATLWPSDEPPPPPTAAVTRGDIEETVLANGVLEAKELVSVGAQVSGQIQKLAVELGDRVEKGQLIAEIDPLTRQNDLRNAEASLANVKAQKRVREATLKQARLAFERQTRMLQGNATSREAYETAEATLATTEAEIAALEAEIAQAEIAVDTARINLTYTKIVAPMEGTVVAVPVKEGQTVNANQTTPTIVMLAELDTMTVSAEVSEADVVRVAPGQMVYFSILSDPETLYYSMLSKIEPAPSDIVQEASASSASSGSASDTAIYYNALFDIANPDHELRISMTAQVSIVIDQAEGALTVPVAALDSAPNAAVPDGGQSVQVLAADGSVARRGVEVGINNGVRAEIRAGLSEGERVVLPEAQGRAGGDQRRRGFFGF
jgi:macrolide-specific efflux system membrane fusion protein